MREPPKVNSVTFLPPEIIPLLVTVLIIQAALDIYCLYNIYKSEKKSRQAKIGWALLVLFVSIIGPVIYLFVGREER